jgi:hypothetical protein
MKVKSNSMKFLNKKGLNEKIFARHNKTWTSLRCAALIENAYLMKYKEQL